MTRENWHEGYERVRDTINHGQNCAGCGKLLGMASWGFSPDYVAPPWPSFPFDEETCPVCYLRDNPREAVDPLTQRMLAMRKRQAEGSGNG